MPEIWPETWMYQFCDFCIFCVLVKKIRQFLQNPVFAKIYFLTFLAISPAIFELQRCTIPHFNPLNNSFWPYEEPFCCRANSFWVIRPNVSTIFFRTHFMKIYLSFWNNGYRIQKGTLILFLRSDPFLKNTKKSEEAPGVHNRFILVIKLKL